MVGLYTRLVVFTVLISIVVLSIFFSLSRKQQDVKSIDIFPVGDVYGVIDWSDASNFFTASFLTENNDYQEQLKLIEQRLKASGILLNRLWLVGNIERNHWCFLLQVRDAKRLLNELDDWAYFLDWKKEITAQLHVYSDTVNKISISTNGQFLAVHYNYQTPDLTQAHPIDIKKWMEGAPQLIIATNWMKDLGVYPINIKPVVEGTTFYFQAKVKTAQPFPLVLNDTPFKTDTAVGVQQWFNLNLSSAKLLSPSSWLDKAVQAGKRIGLPILTVLPHWDGAMTYQRGGDFYYTDTIITTNFDDDFNEIEQRVLRQRKVKAFELVLSSKTSDSLVNHLQSSGFLSQQGRRYFLPGSPPLQLRKGDDVVQLSSQVVHQSVQRDTTNSHLIQFGWRSDFFQLQGSLTPVHERELMLAIQLKIRDITKMNFSIP